MKINEINVGGYIPSTPDSRNYKLDMYKRPYKEAELPIRFENDNLPIVLDQKSSGMCVPFSLCAIKSYQEDIERGKELDFSPAFIYAHKAFPEGEGMFPKVALNRLRDLGTVYFDDLPIIDDATDVINAFNEYKSTFESEDKMYNYSQINRIESYVELDSEREIKEALYEGKLVAIGLKIISDFYRPDENNFIEYNPNDSKKGGHMIFIYGWNEDGWLIQNSWGTDWGNNGRAVLDYNYPLMEAWALYDYTPKIPLDYDTRVELTKDSKTMYINGVEKQLRVAPFFKQYSEQYSALCTELRPIFEELGYTVVWDNESKTATIVK